jgi:hypothetical protein
MGLLPLDKVLPGGNMMEPELSRGDSPRSPLDRPAWGLILYPLDGPFLLPHSVLGCEAGVKLEETANRSQGTEDYHNPRTGELQVEPGYANPRSAMDVKDEFPGLVA